MFLTSTVVTKMGVIRIFSGMSLVLVPALILVTSCKKKKEFKEEDCQATVDTRSAASENDAAINDVNTVIMERPILFDTYSSSTFSSTGGATTSVCGLSIDTTEMPMGIIVLNYNGSICNSRKREGIIKVIVQDYPAKKWKQKGCVLVLEFINYKVSRVSDGRSVQLDGTQYITNENGGSWYALAYLNQPELVQSVTGNDLKVTFNGNNDALYAISRRFTYTFSNLVYTCKVEGTASISGKNDVESWGQTRNGDSFTSEITSPIIWNTSCGPGAPLEGEMVIKVEGKAYDLNCLFGTDADGNQVSFGSKECPYGWKVKWSYKKNTKTRVFGYY